MVITKVLSVLDIGIMLIIVKENALYLNDLPRNCVAKDVLIFADQKTPTSESGL